MLDVLLMCFVCFALLLLLMSIARTPSLEHSLDILESTIPSESQRNNANISDKILEPGSGPSFYEWMEVFPELQVLIDNFEDILEEAKTVHTVKFY
jgi:hypothetical protein